MPASIYPLFHAPDVRNILQGVLDLAGFALARATMSGAVETAGPNRQKARIERARMLGRDGK
jgi:hypothetical protein